MAAPRKRDADRSRSEILDAAERLFAERGYDAATMEAIGAAAGLSRGSPGYFFGSKRRLYEAVVERVFDVREETLDAAFGPVRELGSRPSRRALEHALDSAVGGYLEFLAERPTFVRLMQWEAVAGGGRLARAPHRSTAIERGLGELARALGPRRRGALEPEQLLISFVALCFFPLAHAGTMLPAIGVEPDGDFIAARRRHVVALLAAALADGG